LPANAEANSRLYQLVLSLGRPAVRQVFSKARCKVSPRRGRAPEGGSGKEAEKPPVKTACPICTAIADFQELAAQNHFVCERCGRFVQDLGSGGIGWLNVETPEHRVRLSGWIRRHNLTGGNPLIRPELSRQIKSMRLPGYRERANCALKMIAERFPSLETPTTIGVLANDLSLQGISYSGDADEMMRLLRLLMAEENLRGSGTGSSIRVLGATLTINGMLAAEALGASMSDSPQGFVAMWFDASLNDAWMNGFKKGIEGAGFVAMRIDSKEYVGGISDEVMAEIRKSRFVVVDYTGQRKNVYFEAGFALGLGLMVIPTCRADEASNLEFDIRHMNTLDWHTPEDLASRLNTRIRALIGAGPNLVE
jgi:hypothetical protein